MTLEGELVDSLLGFYCAFGEAVSGPGGYFGRSMQSFDDCLFGGFGLEFPYTIVWARSAKSRIVLDDRALLQHLNDAAFEELSVEVTEEGREWRERTTRAAIAGQRTMFEEIVDTIRSVPSRNGGLVTLLLE